MSLDLAFGIARTGLLATQRALAAVSQNITNANTEGYTRKSVEPLASSWGDQPMGVRSGPAMRQVSDFLLAERDARAGEAAAASLRERLLSPIEAAHGTPGAGDGLGDAVAALKASFLALEAAPGDAARQREVVLDAQTAAGRFNDVGRAVGEARAQAQTGIAEEVGRVNQALRDVATLSTRIRADLSAGLSTAALEDERDRVLSRLSESLPVRVLRQTDGGITLLAKNGLALPLDAGRDAFAASDAAIGPGAFHGPGGTLPGILLQGVDVTAQLSGGRLGELVRLRDETLPRYQAELDLAAATLASRMEAQGLRLFTDASGGVPDTALAYNAPGAGQIGFANAIRVNAAVLAAPSLVRDGTHAVAGTPGGPTAFTPNPAGGPAGFSTLIGRIATFALGEQASAGNDWPAIPSSGLGPDGGLASPFLAPRSVEGYAAALSGAQTADRAAAGEAWLRADTMKRGLDARFQAESGVDPDAEMAALLRLQNAFAANARVLSTAQQMWDTLLAAAR